MKKIFLGGFALILILLFNRCEEPTLVGQDLIPPDDALEVDSIFYDSFALNMFRDDSIVFNGSPTLYLGKKSIENVGHSYANVFTEFYFSGNFNRIDNAVFDSLVLIISPTGFKGDTLTSQNIDVFELADTISYSSEEPFYIGDSIKFGPQLGQFTNALFIQDSVENQTELNNRPLRALLDQTKGDALFQKFNSEEIKSNSAFQQYFKGVGLKTSSSSPGPGWFSLNSVSSNSGLAMYYHNSEDTVAFLLPLTIVSDGLNSEGDYIPGSQNLNQLWAEYTNPVIQTQLNQMAPDGNQDNYLQSGNGIYWTLDLSDLIDQVPDDVSVNFAELKLAIDKQAQADSTLLPASLIAGFDFVRNSDDKRTGALIGLDGSNLAGTPTDGQIFDKNTSAIFLEETDEYIFQIPGTIQSMEQGIIDSKIYITTSSRSTGYETLKLSRPELSLKLIYSKK